MSFLLNPYIHATASTNKAFEADGVDEAILFSPMLNASAGTISFWLELLSHVSNSRHRLLSDTGGNVYFEKAAFAGSYGFAIFDGSGKFTSKQSLSLGTLYHLVGTWNSSRIRFYVDGVQIGADVAAGAIGSVANNLRLGGILTLHSNAIFDNLSIWDTGLTLAQVNEITSLGVSGDLSSHSLYATNLTHWYTFDDALDDLTATTGTVRDQIGTNHGTPQNTEASDLITYP